MMSDLWDKRSIRPHYVPLCALARYRSLPMGWQTSICCRILPMCAYQTRPLWKIRHQWADSWSFHSNPLSFRLPAAVSHLRLPPPVKECRLALEEFRGRRDGVGGTRIAHMHIFS
ncbi:hypothetical protein F3J43_15395 [Pantoea sp. Cy-639]|nr:hypothetical protein [Pantoea sp. Cy-639]